MSATEDLIRPEGVVCLTGPNGHDIPGLPEDSPALEAAESFVEFLRFAPPPLLPDETTEHYRERIGTARWMAWRFTCVNDAGLRDYVAGGGAWL